MASKIPAGPWPDRFLGGALCLDFINTVEYPSTPREEERFTAYAALLHWSEARGTIDGQAAAALNRLARQDGPAAESVFRRGLALRATLKTLVGQLRAGGPLEEAAGQLNGQLATLGAPPALRPGPHGLRLALPGKALEEPLAPVLWSAVSLLTSDDVGLLGQCQAPTCEYVFLDHSRNRSRLWCSTLGCGNRERVRRNYRGAQAAADKG